MFKLKLEYINAIESNKVALVSSFGFSVDQETGLPKKMVLNVCLNRKESCSEKPEFPVYINALNVYRHENHRLLLENFKSGAQFVPVIFDELKLFYSHQNGYTTYWGIANNFVIATKEDI